MTNVIKLLSPKIIIIKINDSELPEMSPGLLPAQT